MLPCSNKLKPQPPEEEVQEQLVAAVTAVSYFIMILQANMLILNILLSKSLQDLWGMLNTQ
jgi:hypothetical protein